MTHGCQNLLLSISEANECLTGVNMKQNQETQRKGKRQHLKTNTAVKTEKKMNKKPYNVLLTSFARSVRESICILFFAPYSKTSGKYFPVQTSHLVNKPLISNTLLAIRYITRIKGPLRATHGC